MQTPAPQPDAAALAAFHAMTPAERARVARLVATTGARLDLAVAAVEAVRPRPAAPPRRVEDDRPW
jgi:hypothetical protein